MTDRHLTDADMPLFTQLRMTAFGQTVIDLANDPACDEWTFSEKRVSPLEWWGLGAGVWADDGVAARQGGGPSRSGQ